MTETTQYAGVPLRDQDVRFTVSPKQAVAATRSLRLRLRDEVRALTSDEWHVQSRCDAWTVQGVVRHVVHVNTIQLDVIDAARTGQRFDFFRSFDPKRTPKEHLEIVGDESIDVTMAALEDTTTRLVAATEPLLDLGGDVLAASPLGRQPWHRAVLHGLFDTAIHERDILYPLGRRPQPPVEEVTAIAAYQVLVVARVLAVVGASVDLGLHFHGGPDLRVRVDGPVVSVATGDTTDAAVTASGEVFAVLDAMAGRGSLGDVLDGPPEVAAALSSISSLI